MIKRNYLLVVGILIATTVMSQPMLIKGKITDADTAMILFWSMGHSDTVFTSNGQFMLQVKLKNPELFNIIFVKNRQSIEALKEGNERKMRSKEDAVSRQLFLAGGELIINTSFSKFNTTPVKLSNHVFQDVYEQFQSRFNPLARVARAIIDSSYLPGKTAGEKKLCSDLLQKVIEVENAVAEKFVKENTTNEVGAYVLYRYYRIEERNRLDSIYQLFGTQLQATAYLKNINDKIKAMSALKKGMPVNSFSASTSNGSIISLADIKEKYILLDFWGSWCNPCINGLPRMKAYYEKYKGKIEFVGIACNDKEAAWRDAIKKNAINWPQVFSMPGKNNLATRYNVEAYPTKILIDNKGNLVDVFIGEGDGFYQKLDSLLTLKPQMR